MNGVLLKTGWISSCLMLTFLPPGAAIAQGGGCTVTNTGANTIDGFLWVGDSGVGEYGLSGSDCDESFDSIIVGIFFGGDGALTVENGAALNAGNYLRAANAGNTSGDIALTTGAQVSAVDCEVSSVDGAVQDSGTGLMTVSGAATSLACADELQVGYDGPGTLEISDAATVTAGRLTSAFEGPGEATLRVQSGGMLEITGTSGACHTFGVRKTGLLDVDGATVAFSDPNGFLCTCTVGGQCSIEVRVANEGLLTTEAGILTQNDTTVTLEGGTVELPADTGSGGGSLGICSGCLLRGDGTVSGELFNQGDLRPGMDLGIGRIDVVADALRGTFGDAFNVSGSTLEMEIAGDASFDQLVVDGDLTLDGNLQVHFIDAYEPAPGSQFPIASAGGTLTYEPSSVQLFGLPPAIEAETSVLAVGDQVVVTVPEPLASVAGLGALGALSVLRGRGSRRARRDPIG